MMNMKMRVRLWITARLKAMRRGLIEEGFESTAADPWFRRISTREPISRGTSFIASMLRAFGSGKKSFKDIPP